MSDRSNLQDLIYNFNIEKQYSKRFTRPDFIDINGSVHVMGVRGGVRGVLQDLITDFFNIEKHDMCPIL